MILFAVLLVVVLAAGVFRGREHLQVLANLPMHRLWLVPLAFVLQLPLMGAPSAPASELLWPRIAFVVSYTLLIWVLWVNRRIAGIPWLGMGVLLNGLAVLINGGAMPISPQAVSALGDGVWLTAVHHGLSKDVVLELSDTRLWFLSDIFVVPKPFPWPTAFSIGDVFIVIGVARFAWHTPFSAMGGRSGKRNAWKGQTHV
ncbi:MAG: DUF5317 domain-containing protein [Chloroflexota bacterium]